MNLLLDDDRVYFGIKIRLELSCEKLNHGTSQREAATLSQLVARSVARFDSRV